MAVPPPRAEVASCRAGQLRVSCHGANFSKPIDPSYPKLAGQHPDYPYAALKAYQTDHNPVLGRNNAIMMGMARPFTHAEIKAISGTSRRCRVS
jgi:cytochrome c553